MPLETLRQQVGSARRRAGAPAARRHRASRSPTAWFANRTRACRRGSTRRCARWRSWLAAEPFRAPEADELDRTRPRGPRAGRGGSRRAADPDRRRRRARARRVRTSGRRPEDAAAAVHRQPTPAAPRRPPAGSRCRCSNSLTRGGSRGVATTARERWFDRNTAG